MLPVSALHKIKFILLYASKGFWDNNDFSRASALSYATLFSLIPACYIALNIMSLFEIGGEDSLNKILDHFLPASFDAQKVQNHFREQIIGYIQRFLSNVRELNTMSMIILIITSISLIKTIESAFNNTWKTENQSNILSRVPMYWAVLTLGPIFFGGWIFISAKLNHLAKETVDNAILLSSFSFILPIFVLVAAFTFLFHKLPAARVRLKDAMIGGLFTAVTLEFIKRLFAWYLNFASTYSHLYGVLASIPLFLLWMYIYWCVVLLGAELSYQIGIYHWKEAVSSYKSGLGDVAPVMGLRIIECLWEQFEDAKKPLSVEDLAVKIGAAPSNIQKNVNLLINAGIVSDELEESRAHALLVSLEQITLKDFESVYGVNNSNDKSVLRRLSENKSDKDLLINVIKGV